jgi:hypothetical protein
MMINWKGFDRKRSWPNFKILSRHSPGRTEENRKTIRIAGRWGRSQDANHSTRRSVRCGVANLIMNILVS